MNFFDELVDEVLDVPQRMVYRRLSRVHAQVKSGMKLALLGKK